MISFIPRNPMGRWLAYELLWALGVSRFGAINVGFAPVDPIITKDARYSCDPAQMQLYLELGKFAVQQGVDWRSAHIFEVGCGTGLGLHLLLEKFRPAAAAGIDYSRVAIKRAKKLGLNVCRGSATSMPVSDQCFDVILSVDCLQSFPKDFFLEARRALRPAGKMLVADFRLQSPESTSKELGEIAVQYGFTLKKFVLRTSSVLEALREDGARKRKLLRIAPKFISGPLAETLSLPGSLRWEQWLRGERIYYFAIFERH